MPIVKQVTKPNGAPIEFHKAASATVDYRNGTAIVQVASWPSAESHDANSSLDWMQPVAVPVAALSDIDAHLTTAQDSPFVGGAVVPDSSESLAACKTRKWARIKSERTTRLSSAGAGSSPPLDTSPEALGNITGVVTYLLAHPEAPGVQFTCADNVRRSIPRQTFIDAATATLAAMQAIYDTADTLRQQIDAAATAAEVEAVVWPA